MAAISEYEKKIFANELMKDQNATRAYKVIRPGVKTKSANNMGAKLRCDAYVLSYISEEMEKNIKNGVADKNEVLQYLTSVMRGGEKEETLKWIGDGIQIIEKIGVSAKDRLKAAELLGKNHGLFTDRVELGGGANIIIRDDLNG